MKRAISGIGVLIIFIAMILVAAVAAMVLLQTVGSLEGQALQTGKESTSEVSSKLRITAITGVTDNAANPTKISYLRIVGRLAPGSDEVNLNYTLMEFLTKDEQSSGISYNMSTNNSIIAVRNATITGKSYSVLYLGKSVTLSNSSRVSVKKNEMVEFWYKTSGIDPSTSVKVTLTPSQGVPESIPFRTPASFEGKYVSLFP
ncbi:hypothetical protein DRN74_00875 [Candidatus Micrarchaeota archaeon]|nr:MAG: hypothetical protein DRN74_00875 [Candidatus Micrarchaeota archaeon]